MITKRGWATLGILLTLVSTVAPAAEPASKAKVWAIVVGVDDYRDPAIPDCPGALEDARALADWFSTTAEWGPNQILRMDRFGVEKPGSAAETIRDLRPTRENLDWAVNRWLRQRLRPGDIVALYFAGQATTRPPRNGAAVGRGYLLPVDARKGDIEATGWSLDDALDRSELARKAHVVIWLDTSLQGRGKGGVERLEGSATGDDWLRALTRWPGVTAWLAGERKPLVEARKGPGPFASALLKGLGSPERAHNLAGCLESLRGDRALADLGFRALGGVDPATSLWSSGILPVEQLEPELVVQAGHGDRVTRTLVTSDGSTLFTASQDATIRVWSLADQALVRVLTDPMGGVESLALNRDGTTLMAGDNLGRLVGWDLRLDRPKRMFGPTVHQAGVDQVAFLPDGKRFVALDRDGRTIAWDSSTGELKRLKDVTPGITARMAAAPLAEPGSPALVLAGDDGILRTFDAELAPLKERPGPGARITELELSSDGQKLVVGDAEGRVLVYEGERVPYDVKFAAPIRQLRLAASGLLFVNDGAGARLVDPARGGSGVPLTDPLGKPIAVELASPTFSTDGRWLAARTSERGRVLAWNLVKPENPVPLPMPADASAGISLAFTPDGRSLISGDQDGGIRSWVLDATAVPRPRILPARGRVATLDVSRSGRYLLEVTKDDVALLWDLKEGRGARAVPGTWLSGAFLPDETTAALCAHPDKGGDVMLVDLERPERKPTRLERPSGLGSTSTFASVRVSRSGRYIAAGSLPSEPPVACVWRVDTGALVHVIRAHSDGITAIDLSSDDTTLLTASRDGTVKTWRLGGPELELTKPPRTLRDPRGDGSGITTARLSPSDPGRIAAGTADGSFVVWDATGREVIADKFSGAVEATVFASDGAWVAASGALEKMIRFWATPSGSAPRPVVFKPAPHHSERVGALLAWPGGTMLLSGGDDAALRFWDLQRNELLGTLTAAVRSPGVVDWLAFTPDGQFDGSLPGEALVKWRIGERLLTVEQARDTHHHFQLVAELAQGKRPAPMANPSESPAIKIVAPPPDRPRDARDVQLTLWTSLPALRGMRLYQNGVPARSDDDFKPGETEHFQLARIKLRKGENRIYAMGSAAGATDGRSEELVLNYDGDEPTGKVHVLALGISKYANRPLKYADVDATKLAGFLHERGARAASGAGERITLLDADVTPDNVEDAFRRLRDATRGRPEDTVVLFLAGHTDTDDSTRQFCLLLPRFPFDPPPAAAAGLAQVAALDKPGGAAFRGNVGLQAGKVDVNDDRVMPYVRLYNRLIRLEALQRLVVVDACQAGAIADDPAVLKIRRIVASESRKARTSYLLAARRGEPAAEVDALQHGLLTYTLLKGMGAPGLVAIADDLGGFPGPGTADRNGDGILSTDELVAYTDETLPRLARVFPQIVLRAGARPLPPLANEPKPELEARLKVQSGDASFPLLVLPE